MTPAEQANLPRARGQAGPHYEVWFIEVQDTARKTGLWLRYTLRIPAHGGAVAQVWATYYDRADPARSFGLVRTGAWRFDPWALVARRRAVAEIERGADDEARMDRLLDKIHREGIGSLTRSEKAFLERMSSRR